MNIQTTTPDGSGGMIDRKIQKHLGVGIRDMYAEEGSGELSDELKRQLVDLERRERIGSEFKLRVTARLGILPESESQYLEQSRALDALCSEYAVGRSHAYGVFCEIIWLFGKTRLDPGRTLIPPDMTIHDWGGWPKFIGVPEGNAEQFWHRFTMAVQPKSDDEWTYFFEKAGAFASCLMIRHRTNPCFWNALSCLPKGPFSTEAAKILRTLTA